MRVLISGGPQRKRQKELQRGWCPAISFPLRAAIQKWVGMLLQRKLKIESVRSLIGDFFLALFLSVIAAIFLFIDVAVLAFIGVFGPAVWQAAGWIAVVGGVLTFVWAMWYERASRGKAQRAGWAEHREAHHDRGLLARH
jgi:hypothetical protein